MQRYPSFRPTTASELRRAGAPGESKPLIQLARDVLTMISSPSSSAVDVATTNADSPMRGPRTSDRSSPPTVIASGEQSLQDGEKMPFEPPPLSSAADHTSPQPQPQPQSHPEPAEPEPEPEPELDPAAIAAEAEKLKEQGNESFKLGRYGEAVDLYTKAISTSSPRPPSPSALSLSSFPPCLPSYPFYPQSLLRRAELLMGNNHI